MKRRRRTEILIQADPGLARSFAETIMQHYECQEIIPPTYGLTMIKMRESAKKTLFYIGEVLVTEAKVELNQAIGIGIVVGMEEELSKHLAIIDAAYKADVPETREWLPELLEAERLMTEGKAKAQADLFETKVNFDTMDV